MAISSIGVGSGLPIEDLLSKLRKSENVALELVQKRQVEETSRLSAYGSLKSALEAFNTAAAKLGDPGVIGAMKASSNNDAITVSASEKAIAGQYRITVNTLASAQTLTTSGQADRTSAIGTGGVITFTLADGTEKTLKLDGEATSLDDLVEAINTDDSLGFSATIINDGSENAPFRLMLTANDTGTDAAIASIAVADNDALHAVLGFSDTEPHTLIEQKAVNASIYINGAPENGGIAITSQSNQLDDVIEGVTLTLTKSSTDPVTVTVARNEAATADAIKAFVNTYNNLQTTIRNLTSYNIEKQQGSALTGDSLARRMQSQMRIAIGFNTNAGDVRSLADLGVVTSDFITGTLKVDEEKLSKAIKENSADLSRLFVGENSLSQQVVDAADLFLRSDGYIASAEEGTSKILDRLDDQYLATSQRIDATMEAYRQQFINLDKTLAQMNSLSSYLTQQLSMLGSINEKS